MQARSALFDLYGDYLRPRGGRAPVAALVRLLAPLGIAPPAVRTAVSRMVRQGWLHPLRLAAGPGYLLTPKAARRLDEAAARIYRTGQTSWDGRFDLVVLEPRRRAGERQRLGGKLSSSGTARSTSAPGSRRGPADEVDALLTESGVRYERFTRQPRRRYDRRRGAGPPRLGPRRDRRRRTSGSSPSSARCWPRSPPAATTRRRTRPGSGWCTPGVPSCSGTRSCRRPCCPTRWPGAERGQRSSTGTRPGCGRPPTATSTAASTCRSVDRRDSSDS